jgi:hypothetical protein
MASEEHVDRLKQDVKAWNAWRAENRDIRPKLLMANRRTAEFGQISRRPT